MINVKNRNLIKWFSALIIAVSLLIVVDSLVENAFADIAVNQKPLGSGDASNKSGMQKGSLMFERQPYSEGVFFTPQYMPGYPTSSTIWPRIVDVDCVKVGHDAVCDGYNWTPDKGRGEYLMYRPKFKETKVERRTIYIEVPQKPKAQ